MVKNRPFSPLQANVTLLPDAMFPLYVIRGERNALIDSAILAKAGEIEKKLSALLGDGGIDMLLLTHSHYDHTGACSRLQDKYGFEIVASRRTKEILENDKAIAFIDGLNQKFKEILHDHSASAFTMPRNIRAVGENDRIPISAKQSIEVFETPGHTRCSISFLLRPENILFPGDAAGVMEKNGTIKPLFLSSYTHYEASLKKLLALEPEVLALAHNTAIRGREKAKKFLDDSLAETRKLKEKIIAWLGQTDDFGRIAEKILAEEYAAPTIMGPREALVINVTAMVKSVYFEFVKIP
jgi:glyoxylase-like metal-dependent hydrolase (beta-lactamase superfamily II)